MATPQRRRGNVWTKQPRGAEGYYWFRAAPSQVVKIVYLTASGLVFFAGAAEMYKRRDLSGMWFGPLEEPDDE